MSVTSTATATAAHSVSLTDKYELPQGRLYMTGTQALVRLLMAQKERDAAAGLNTGGFVSGYRGSPLGALDQELWKAKKYLAQHNIVFQPGLNEELGATAVWGTQMVSMDPLVKVDGVFSLWYGKGPGVDRSGDVFKHGNIAGCSKHGGVLLVAGDDHACKSSSLPHQSEHAFIAAMIPVLNPSGVREFIEFGLHGFAMSRYSGCWVGFKAISDTIETSSSFDIDPMAVEIRIPDSYPIPPDGFSIRWPDPPLEQENRLQRERLYALLEYVRLNRLNRIVLDAPQARLGIATTGKSYLDVMEALQLLGLNEQAASQLGLRVLKIGVSWPLEPQCIVDFALGLDEILVVEEKRQVLEYQIKEHLYNAPHRPRVVGKFDETGEWVKVPSKGILLSPNGELATATVAGVIAQRLAKVWGAHHLPEAVQHWLPRCEASDGFVRGDKNLPQRLPFFCSGCPHNTSTQVPEGSRALAGIGCHYMAMWMDRRTDTFSQMGGEGVSWIGQAPFTATSHVFVNLGDGTYMHSGSLAIRAAVAAKINITYKILVNDAVAMTGGQPVEGAPSAGQIVRQVHAEGVREIRVVTDEPAQFSAEQWPAGVRIQHRDEMDTIQRELRELPGVTVIVYAQVCAAEKRRRRKKKELVDPPRRVVINEHVCEGCGDCGQQSNCVSVLPLETELGRKRTIDQSSCNKDFSCVKGFCPSFVTVEGGALRKPDKKAAAVPDNLPEPALPSLDKPCKILITGMGGTGVVTIGALLGMAAHIERKGVLVMDMAGLAQKGGAVMSHVKLAATPQDLFAARIASRDADVLLGCDMLVSSGPEATKLMTQTRTRGVLNTDVAPTGAFTQDPDWQAEPDKLLARVAAVSEVQPLEATRLATALMGDAVATNVFMLGFAYQTGWIALHSSSLLQAIEINGAAVAMNKAAFAWGRQAALDLNAVRQAAGLQIKEPGVAPMFFLPRDKRSLQELLDDRAARLTAYQNPAWARRYVDFVQQLARTEKLMLGGDRLSKEVALSLFKLMSYKDEYEVARLYTETGFFERIAKEFEGDYQLRFHLAPPLLSRQDAQGHLVKKQYGPWVARAFKLLARLKGLRGTKLDVFGYTQERRQERQAIADYQSLILSLVPGLTDEKLPLALELARGPQTVRGFGHVKEAHHQNWMQRQQLLLAQYQNNQPTRIHHAELEVA